MFIVSHYKNIKVLHPRNNLPLQRIYIILIFLFLIQSDLLFEQTFSPTSNPIQRWAMEMSSSWEQLEHLLVSIQLSTHSTHIKLWINYTFLHRMIFICSCLSFIKSFRYSKWKPFFPQGSWTWICSNYGCPHSLKRPTRRSIRCNNGSSKFSL